MSIKFNCDQCYHARTFSEELLTNCKKATVTHNKYILSIWYRRISRVCWLQARALIHQSDEWCSPISNG